MKKKSLFSYCMLKYKISLLCGLAFLSFQPIVYGDFVNTMKGIGGDFKSFGEKIGSASFWEAIGRGFGAAPTGYVYSYTVINDTAFPIFVDTQTIASFMGASFPTANGYNRDTLQPYEQSYVISNKQYYFEMSIHHQGANEPTNQLPYVNTDALYIQDCIQLDKEHSTKMNYFHVYLGKEIQKGRYLHTPKAEFIGYANPSDPKDKGASVKIVNALTGSPALIIYNSTSDDFVIGYSSQAQAASLSKKDCDVFLGDILHDSFVTYAAPNGQKQVALGTLGFFATGSDTASAVLAMPPTVFDGKTYTIEIYQDAEQSPRMCIQALSSAHDVPSYRVCDLTPVPCVFWYQSVAQLNKSNAKNMSDLPGQVWVVSVGDKDVIEGLVPLGQALQFNIIRPVADQKRWVYFLYVDVAQGDPKGKQFVDNFVAGTIGADLIAKYDKQGVDLFNQTQKDLSNVLTFKASSNNNTTKANTVTVPESLLVAALQGSLKVDGGQIQDTTLQVTGYLLGGDLFLPQGVGASQTMYYQLSPSQQTSGNIPTASVTNGYTMGITKAPKGMPTPGVYVNTKSAVVSSSTNSSAIVISGYLKNIQFNLGYNGVFGVSGGFGDVLNTIQSSGNAQSYTLKLTTQSETNTNPQNGPVGQTFVSGSLYINELSAATSQTPDLLQQPAPAKLQWQLQYEYQDTSGQDQKKSTKWFDATDVITLTM